MPVHSLVSLYGAGQAFSLQQKEASLLVITLICALYVTFHPSHLLSEGV